MTIIQGEYSSYQDVEHTNCDCCDFMWLSLYWRYTKLAKPIPHGFWCAV